MKILIGILIALFLSVIAQAEPKARMLSYKVDGRSFMNVLVTDGSERVARPGILLLPEWWGITPHERDVANRLAKSGYAVMIVDLYGEGMSTQDPMQANAWMQEAQKSPEILADRFDRALDELARQPSVDVDRLAAIGFGLGGGLVVDEARKGVRLKAAIDFYGGLNSPTGRIARRKTVRPEVLVLVGQNDQYVAKNQIDHFRVEMKAAKANFTVKVLPKALHDFARAGVDPIGKKYNLPLRYDAAAESEAWRAVDRVLKRDLASVAN